MGSCCCEKNRQTKDSKCCVCNPFQQDAFLLTAQIASILATTISWYWWPTFVLSAPVVTLLQVAWCCKMKKRGLYAAAAMAYFAFLGALFMGIWMIVECWNTLFLVIIERNDDDYYYDRYFTSRCTGQHRSVAWGTVALVDAALFLLTALCTTHFVRTRYDAVLARQAEAEAQDETFVQTVEMAVPAASATVVLSQLEKEDRLVAEELDAEA